MKDIIRFINLYRPVALWVLLGAVLSLVTLLASIGLLAISGWFIAAMGLAGVAGVTMNYFTPAAVIRGLAMLRTGGRYAERLATHDAALKTTARIRLYIFEKLTRLRTPDFKQTHSADLFSILRGDTEVLEKFFLTGFTPVCVALLAGPAVCGVMWVLMPSASYVLLAFMILSGICIPYVAYRLSRGIQHQIAQDAYRMRIVAADYIHAMDELVVLGVEKDIADRFMTLDHMNGRSQMRVALFESLSSAVTQFLLGLSILIVMVLGVPYVNRDLLPPAYFAVLPLLIMASFDVVAFMPAAVQSFAASSIAARRLFALTDQPAESSEFTEMSGDAFNLVIRNLSFGYTGGRSVLRDVSLELNRADAVAVVGPSGSGKTTLLHILMGMFPAQAGQVFLNGTDLAHCNPDDWRRHFSVAEQRPFLFAGTIRDNLLYANPRASDEDMLKACHLAGLDSDLAAMPKGLDTDIGEGAQKISGGQMRRLAIARACLKVSGCLILDEPTEGLDKKMAIDLVSRLIDHTKTVHQSLLVVTHDPAIAALFNRRICLAG